MTTLKYGDIEKDIEEYFKNLTKEQMIKNLTDYGFEVEEVDSKDEAGFEIDILGEKEKLLSSIFWYGINSDMVKFCNRNMPHNDHETILLYDENQKLGHAA